MHAHLRNVIAGVAGALIVGGAASIGGPASAQGQPAQNWPTKPVTFVVPFPAGGGTDAFARPLAAQLETQLGQRIVIENRGGAGGTVGASHASKQAGDGYTFFIGAAHHAIAPALYSRLDYNILTDFVPVGVVAEPPQVIVANPKVPAKDLKELLALAKASPGKLNFASAGNGTTHHLAGELFKLMTGTQITHVPYRGAGPALQDLVSGHVQIMFDGLGSSAGQIASGNLRGIAVASAKRAEAFPDMPTAAEAGLPGYEVATWYAMWATKGTPAPIVARMEKELKAAFDAPAIKGAWTRNGSPVPNLYGEAFGKFVASEVERWGKVVKDSNVKLEQ